MTARKYLLPLAGGLLLISLAVLWGTASYFQRTAFDGLERRLAARDLTRALNVLREEQARLGVTLADWAIWDETYSFMRKPGQEFIDSNLNDRTIAALQLEAVVFLDAAGKVVTSKRVEAGPGSGQPLPEGLGAWLESRFAKRPGTALQDRGKGFLLLPGGVFVVASCPVLRSDGSGPALGSVVMCRPLGAKEIEEIGELLRMRLALHRADIPLPVDLAPLKLGESRPEIPVMAVLPDGAMGAGALVAGMDGSPAFYLTTRERRDISQTASQALLHMGLAAGACLAVFAAGCAFLLSRQGEGDG